MTHSSSEIKEKIGSVGGEGREGGRDLPRFQVRSLGYRDVCVIELKKIKHVLLCHKKYGDGRCVCVGSGAKKQEGLNSHTRSNTHKHAERERD